MTSHSRPDGSRKSAAVCAAPPVGKASNPTNTSAMANCARMRGICPPPENDATRLLGHHHGRKWTRSSPVTLEASGGVPPRPAATRAFRVQPDVNGGVGANAVSRAQHLSWIAPQKTALYREHLTGH